MENTQDNNEITGPVVFQCETCRCILGDSMTFISANDVLETITLSNVQNVKQLDETNTSKKEHDFGSTFHELLCLSCQASLGKVYLTTARHLDSIRDLFTLDTKSITSYQVGGLLNPDHKRTLPSSNADSYCHEDMIKVQNIVLLLDERLGKIEQRENKRKR